MPSRPSPLPQREGSSSAYLSTPVKAASRSLSYNTLLLLVGNTGSAALSFLLSVLIGRVLGQDGLGVYAAALAWVFPLSLVAEFGISTLITRDLAYGADEGAYLRAAALARLLLGGGLMLALVIVAPLLSDHPAVVSGLQLSAPLVLLLPLFSTFSAVFRARQAVWPIPWLNIAMLAAQVALTALVFWHSGDVLAALAVNTLTSAGQVVAAWWVWRRWFALTPQPTHPQGERKEPHPLTPSPLRREGEIWQMGKLLRRAWPFAAAAVLAALQLRLNAVLLERLTTTAEVGYYAAVLRFVEAGKVAPNALFGALLPALLALTVQPDELWRTFRRVMLGLGVFGAALGLLFTVFGAGLLHLTYGAAFADSVPALHIAMWSLLPGLLRGGLTLRCFAFGQEHVANRVNLAVLGLQIVLGLALIPPYGAAGAALTLLLTEAAALALLARVPGITLTQSLSARAPERGTLRP